MSDTKTTSEARATLIYRIGTVHCSNCDTRIRYGIKPLYCANCGVRFTAWDDSQVKDAPGEAQRIARELGVPAHAGLIESAIERAITAERERCAPRRTSPRNSTTTDGNGQTKAIRHREKR